MALRKWASFVRLVRLKAQIVSLCLVMCLETRLKGRLAGARLGKLPQRSCPWLCLHLKSRMRAGCGRALCPPAQDFHGALKKAFELTRFDAHARINFFGKIPRGLKIAF